MLNMTKTHEFYKEFFSLQKKHYEAQAALFAKHLNVSCPAGALGGLEKFNYKEIETVYKNLWEKGYENLNKTLIDLVKTTESNKENLEKFAQDFKKHLETHFVKKETI